MSETTTLDPVDRALIEATQGGLPLLTRPFDAIAEQLGLETQEVIERLRRLRDSSVLRRIGAVPNHYRLGYVANGMSVWDVDDELVDELGREIADLDFVTHCYRRPRRPPIWRYNLFAMVHSRCREEVEEKITKIASILGENARSSDVLYSTRILKKTGLRLKPGG